MCEYEDMARLTSDLLKTNTEWENRYAQYADDILARCDVVKKAKKMFRGWEPFGVYISTSAAKDSVNVVKYSLRYKGQHVADLKVLGRKVTINTDEKTAKNNSECFQYHKMLQNIPWNSKAARDFRAFFREKNPHKDSHFEHMLESLILGELVKNKKTTLRGMKPIQIGGVRYSMPTPLKASGASVEYAGRYGGGIDIFTRCRTNGEVRLNVMELKDENVKSEPPQKVVKQAIKYAVFIQHLLRSKSGQKWWSLFGFSRDLPEHITINATCVMPTGSSEDKSFANKIIDVNGDTIQLHYIYFSPDFKKGTLEIVDSSI